FVNPLGKSSKSATITAKLLNKELYAGGALAVANHIADFVKEVVLITSYGVNDSINYFDFIKNNVHPNVRIEAVFTPDRPTTLKRRFVDHVFKHKLFEAIEIDDSPLEKEQTKELEAKLLNHQDSNLMVVTDFGHGLIDQRLETTIAAMDVFTAVNTQTNSANQGFNVISKYSKVDYFSIDKIEAQLAVHDKQTGIEETLFKLINIVQAEYAAITLGVNGCVIGSKMVSRLKHLYYPVKL
ncbi:MAG: hypothetical protein JKY54_11445, partial [Flavobacteriales bacterium]|nr:hypothetical protein [Flavobacteriales bacterium]